MKKPIHYLILGLALFGAIYVYHMVTAHQGTSILPVPSH